MCIARLGVAVCMAIGSLIFATSAFAKAAPNQGHGQAIVTILSKKDASVPVSKLQQSLQITVNEKESRIDGFVPLYGADGNLENRGRPRFLFATRFSRVMEAAGHKPSALSAQLLNKLCNFSRFTEQNFFAKCKEVTDKESIGTRRHARCHQLIAPILTDLTVHAGER